MKKLNNIFFILLFFAAVTFAQTAQPKLQAPSFFTNDGYHAVYTIAMTDSEGTTYSPAFELAGYLPQNLTTYPIICNIIGSGTADSVKVTVQGRKKKANLSYSTWKVLDTASVTFNKVDGYAYPYNINFNGQRPDQMRFVVTGASSVNRADVTITVIADLIKQYGIFSVR